MEIRQFSDSTSPFSNYIYNNCVTCTIGAHHIADLLPPTNSVSHLQIILNQRGNLIRSFRS